MYPTMYLAFVTLHTHGVGAAWKRGSSRDQLLETRKTCRVLAIQRSCFILQTSSLAHNWHQSFENLYWMFLINDKCEVWLSLHKSVTVNQLSTFSLTISFTTLFWFCYAFTHNLCVFVLLPLYIICVGFRVCELMPCTIIFEAWNRFQAFNQSFSEVINVRSMIWTSVNVIYC